MSLYKRKEVWWIYITRPDGTRIRRSAGTADRQEAQQYHDKLKHEMWVQRKLEQKPRRTWDEACLQWIREKGDKKSIENDKTIIRKLIPYLRGKYLDEMSRQMITLIGESIKAKTSPARANRYLALIRSILNRAASIWEWIDKAPRITLYKEPKGRIRYLSSDELTRLLAFLPEHQKPIFMFSILTGLRKHNVLGLKWEQVDLANSIIIFRGDEMKAGENHSVFITETVRDILLSQKGNHPEYVFTYEGRPVKEINTRAFRNALKNAGITDYRWHDNRHTWATLALSSGISLHELQIMGAWKSSIMAKRYAHVMPENIRHNAEKIERKIRGYATFTPHGTLQ